MSLLFLMREKVKWLEYCRERAKESGRTFMLGKIDEKLSAARATVHTLETSKSLPTLQWRRIEKTPAQSSDAPSEALRAGMTDLEWMRIAGLDAVEEPKRALDIAKRLLPDGQHMEPAFLAVRPAVLRALVELAQAQLDSTEAAKAGPP